MRSCEVPGCDLPHKGHGYCAKHWARWRKHGDPLVVLEPVRRGRGRVPAIDRFLKLTRKTSGCWEWVGSVDRKTGYGKFRPIPDEATRGAHRWAYEHFVGDVPAGLQIDHVCRNRRCVNPDHLEAVTPKENVRRSSRVQNAIHACPHGHSYTPENTFVDPKTGWRRCRTCKRAADSARKKRAREAKRQQALTGD